MRPASIYVRVFPFRGRTSPLKDVTEAEARDYSGQREYGGWGVRTTAEGGKAYTAYGTRACSCGSRSDERILIGTQRADEFTDALRQAGVFVR